MHPITRRQTIADALRRSALRLPAKTAIVCGSTTWTYAQFDAVVTRIACALAERGVRVGDRVAVLARNSHGFAALRFALARIGAVLVPINFMLKADEVAYILRHAGAQTLATDSGLADLARAAATLDTQVRDFIWLPSEDPTEPVTGMVSFDELAACTAPLPEVTLSSTDLAQIVYTSGTESTPKGAMLTHDAVLWQYVSCVVDAAIAADDLALHALPLYHCAQLDVFFGPAIYMGSTNIITAKPVPDNLLPLIAKHRITSFFAPPTVWIALLRSPLFDDHRPVESAQRLLRRFHHAGGGAARAGSAPSEGAAMEPLWPDRDRATGHDAGARRPVAQARLLRARRAERGNARGGRPTAGRGGRRGRRDRAPLAAPDAGLLPRRRADPSRVRGRLVPQRRPGHHR